MDLFRWRRSGKLSVTYTLPTNLVSFLSHYSHSNTCNLFERSPTIPLAFKLHEKRDQKYHERFLTKKERATKNTIVLSLYFSQRYDVTQIQCSRAGVGKYTLKGDCNFAKVSVDEVHIPKTYSSTEELFEGIMQQVDDLPCALNSLPHNSNHKEGGF